MKLLLATIIIFHYTMSTAAERATPYEDRLDDDLDHSYSVYITDTKPTENITHFKNCMFRVAKDSEKFSYNASFFDDDQKTDDQEPAYVSDTLNTVIGGVKNWHINLANAFTYYINNKGSGHETIQLRVVANKGSKYLLKSAKTLSQTFKRQSSIMRGHWDEYFLLKTRDNGSDITPDDVFAIKNPETYLRDFRYLRALGAYKNRKYLVTTITNNSGKISHFYIDLSNDALFLPDYREPSQDILKLLSRNQLRRLESRLEYMFVTKYKFKRFPVNQIIRFTANALNINVQTFSKKIHSFKDPINTLYIKMNHIPFKSNESKTTEDMKAWLLLKIHGPKLFAKLYAHRGKY